MALSSPAVPPVSRMSTKSPSSKRFSKYRKHDCYGAELRCARLRRLQQLLTESTCETQGKCPQALLGILGIDSRYNEGMHELINYLTFGGFEAFKVELERQGYDEEDLSDAMLCIRKERVDVYCSPASYRCLLPHIAPWRNLRIHCLGTKPCSDSDAAEEFKVKTLVSMVKESAVVGLPFSARNHGGIQFDPMKVEQWPIIQAYALEDYGSGTFFTLEHSVVDLSRELHALYREVDPATLTALTCELLPCLEKQWDNMERTIDVAVSGDGAQMLSADQIAEPLLTYHSHGQVGSDQSLTEGRIPYVLFGKDTNRAVTLGLGVRATTGAQPASPTTTSTGTGSHMVCQVVSPRNDVCCSRTYFFESQTSADSGGSQGSSSSVESRIVHMMYKVAIEAVTEAIRTYCTSVSSSVTKASQAALAVLEKSRGPLFDFSVHFELQSTDGLGRTIIAPDCGRSSYPKTASLIIHDIRQSKRRDSNVCLGTVVFSECFIESAIMHSDADGREVSLSCEYIVLTKTIPRWASWQTSPSERQLWSAIPSKLSGDPSFGKLLLPGHAVDAAANNRWVQLVPGSLFVYETGLLFTNTRAGPLILRKENIKAIEFYDGDSPSVPAFILLRITSDARDSIPDYLESSFLHVIFVLSAKTKAYKAFFTDVLHVWKSAECMAPLFRIVESLPGEALPVQEAAEIKLINGGGLPGSAGDGMSAQSNHQLPVLSGIDRFAVHLMASYCLRSTPVFTRDLPALLKQPKAAPAEGPEESTESVQLVVTIVSGIPGSHKEHLCSTLTALAQENSRWVVFRQPLDAAAQRLNVDNLQATLQQYYGNLKKKLATSGSSKCSRMLVVTPGYTEASEVVKAVLNHPNAEVASHVKIGAINTCIDPLNAFMFGRCTFPRLLDMCATGWVNNIVFTSCTNLKSEPLAAIQELLRAVNNNVAFILADKGEVTRSPDIDLILSDTAFDDAALLRSRLLCNPQCQGCVPAMPAAASLPMSQCILKFSQPLVKSKLLAHLRALKHSVDGFSQGSIYHVVGRVRFEDSEQTYEVSHTTLSCSTAIEHAVAPPASPSHSTTSVTAAPAQAQRWFMVFVGYGLQEHVLKDWLRKCAAPKPELLPLKSPSMVSTSEKKQIHHARHHEPLPAGWFYNGSQYVSLMGDRSDYHPNMAQFIEEYVEEQNLHANEFNKELIKNAYHDLFE